MAGGGYDKLLRLGAYFFDYFDSDLNSRIILNLTTKDSCKNESFSVSGTILLTEDFNLPLCYHSTQLLQIYNAKMIPTVLTRGRKEGQNYTFFDD